MQLGKLGVLGAIDALPAKEAAGFVKRVEDLGYSAFWFPEAVGRNSLVHAAWLLANTSGLIVATGIANIHFRAPHAAAAAQKTLAEQSGGRFLLGLGVSHAPIVEGILGKPYEKPLSTMRAYLDAMAKAPFMAVPPSEKPRTVIAALGPKMLALAGERADGALTYNATPEHTARARATLGRGKWLCATQAVLNDTNAASARVTARKSLAIYLTLPNYLESWKRQGFNDSDFQGGGSDRLVDAMVAWGDETKIRARIKAHHDAGADHVAVHALAPKAEPFAPPDLALLKRLAPGA
jgi:probable F420-dependent oxidoreductase